MDKLAWVTHGMENARCQVDCMRCYTPRPNQFGGDRRKMERREEKRKRKKRRKEKGGGTGTSALLVAERENSLNKE